MYIYIYIYIYILSEFRRAVALGCMHAPGVQDSAEERGRVRIDVHLHATTRRGAQGLVSRENARYEY